MEPIARRAYLLFITGCVLLAASLACNLPGQEKVPDATLTALSKAVLLTATAGAGEEGGSSDELATAQVEATRRSQLIDATRTADASNRDEDSLTTATVSAPMVAELPLYGVDPEKGHLGWSHDPVTITTDGYHQMGYANDFMQVVAKDFVLAADVGWNTQYGASGCGFMFRSNGDKNNPDQYMVIATRLGNGHVIFTALADGQLANVQDFFPKTQDRSFQWQNDTVNRLVIVAQGPVIQIYTNGVKIGEVDTAQPPPVPALPSQPKLPAGTPVPDALKKYQAQLKEYDEMVSQVQFNYQLALKNYRTTEAVFDQGFVAMLALSESGHTECKFEKAWLWLIEP